jgi:acyl phosphate:glycerol-3-phosphate acyltransferase
LIDSSLSAMLQALPQPVLSLLAVLAAYLMGSLSFGVIVSRLLGLGDPRSYGSKNPGATNVLRSGNKSAAVMTLVLDAAKGWLPVFLMQAYGPDLNLQERSTALVALAAFLGHLYPVFFGFKGGKGVATAGGVLVGINPWLGLACALVWVLCAVITRISSLSALAAALAAPVIYLMASGELWSMNRPVLAAVGAMTALLLYRHRENIGRLVQGKEPRIGAGANKPPQAARQR